MSVLVALWAVQALVTGVSAEGVYLNVGATSGVRIGDVLELGGVKLSVVEVGPHQSRTGPPANPYVVVVGTHVQVEVVETPGAPAPPSETPAGPIQPAPKLDPAGAPALWAGAETGWSKPQPFHPRGGKGGPGRDETSPWHVRGDVSLTTTDLVALGGDASSFATLGSKLGVSRDSFRYDHDVRLNGSVPTDVVGESSSYLEPRRLEVGWSTPTWGARGGRFMADDRLAGGSVDGAAVRLTSPGDDLDAGAELYGGFVPAEDNLSPTVSERTAGLSGHLGARTGDWRFDATAGANTVAHNATVDRLATGPELVVSHPWVTTVLLATLDLKPSFTLSELYGSTDVTISSHADVGLRYGRFQQPAYGQEMAGAVQEAWLDARLDAEFLGIFSPRFGYLVDDFGTSLCPGLDWRKTLTRSWDVMAGYEYDHGPWQTSQTGRAHVVLRLEDTTLAELALGGRGTVIQPVRGLASDVEKTVDLGAWLRLPSDLDLHVYAEGTMAWQNRVVALADLRWRFGP